MAFGDLMIGWLLITHAEIAAAALENGASDRDQPFYEGKVAAREVLRPEHAAQPEATEPPLKASTTT